MTWLILSSVIAAVAAVAVPLELGRRNGRRWGFRREPRTVDPNPYRGATVHEESERGAPFFVRFAAGANIAWGLLTMLLFAPAGCLLLLMAAQAPLVAVFLPPVLFSGFLLSFRLMSAAGGVLQRRTANIERTVRWSVAHHLTVAAVFAVGGVFLFDDGWPWGLVPTVPATIGLAFALLLRAAARRVGPEPSEEDS